MEKEMENMKEELRELKVELNSLKRDLRMMNNNIEQVLEDTTHSITNSQAIKEIQSTIQKIGREENWATDVWFMHTLTRPELIL